MWACRWHWRSRASSRSGRVRRQQGEGRGASPRFRPKPGGLRTELKESSLAITSDIADLKAITFFVVAVPTPVDHNNVPDLTPVVKASETVGKVPVEGRRRRLRIDRLPGRHRRRLRADPRQGLGPDPGQGLQARLLARAHQPRRQGAHARAHHEGRLGRRRRDARARRRRLRRDHRRRRASRVVHQGRRGREGHREHAARSQHRAHERAGDHLRSHGHPHRATCSKPRARSGTS